MHALQSVGVLVTRPEHQATPLCRLLESRGATAFRLPALDIRSVGDRQDAATRIGPLEAFDLVVFTSANAVRFGASLLEQRRDLTIAAIGPATARALNEAGYGVTVAPEEGFDSESLLRHPALEHPAGRRVLLIKGMHGRELLQQQLTRRGAELVVVEVYRRERAHPSAADLAALEANFAAGVIQVITATSAEIAANLFELATPGLRREFARVHWLVPGIRVATAVRELGMKAPILQADSAEDHDLVTAIMRWRSSVSGA